ncbi:hypothetical protein Rs2_16555 [Raphanus sativus]|nr:hypothetical protein Rs2_16555 [Raphanus sativus]
MDRTHLMEWWDSDGLDYTSVQQSLQPSHPRASLTFQPLPGLRRPMVDGNGSHHSRRKTGMYQNPKVPSHLVDDCPPTRASGRNPTLGIRHAAKHVDVSLQSLHLAILLVWMSYDFE